MSQHKDIIELLVGIKELLSQNNLLTKEFLTIEETSRFLGVSTSCVYKLTSSKKLTYYKPSGKLIYIKREDLEKFVFKNPVLSDDDLDEVSANYILKID